jgi:hypothetical protein
MTKCDLFICIGLKKSSSKSELSYKLYFPIYNGFAFMLQGYGEINKCQCSKLPANSKQRIAEPVSLKRLLCDKTYLGRCF